MVNAAKVHSIYMCAKLFADKIERANVKDPALRGYLTSLGSIFMSQQLLENGQFLLLEGLATAQQFDQLREHIGKEIRRVRPQLLNIVEAFEIADETLNSAIGHSDGRAYERLWEAALSSPINRISKL